MQLSLPTRFGVAENRWAAAERGAAAVITAAATAAAQAAPPSSDHHLYLFSGTHWTEKDGRVRGEKQKAEKKIRRGNFLCYSSASLFFANC